MTKHTISVALVVLVVIGTPIFAKADRLSAALRARLEAAGQPDTFVEGVPEDSAIADDRGLTVYVKEDGARPVYDEVKQLAENAGVEAYGLSEEAGFFHLTGATEEMLTDLLAIDRVSFVEESEVPSHELEIVPFNRDAQDTHEVDILRQRHLLDGTGVTVGVWDEGSALATHVEFGDRVLVRDGASPAEHATHVTGTIAAGGEDRQAEGMAPEATVHSYDWTADLSELAASVADGVVVSNHSYGFSRGWARRSTGWYWYGDPSQSAVEDYRFGKYSGVSRSFDRIAFENRGLTIFVAAGNDRNDDPARDPAFNGLHYVPALQSWSDDARNSDGYDHGGFDTVAGAAVAKNVISVGAIEDVVGTQPNAADIQVTHFSSWGPADDGRVKPDLVANGADLYSPTAAKKLDGTYYLDRYVQLPGTSMASPVGSGVAVLLNELAKKEFGRSLYADEVKALLVHTALSPNRGPSYRIGWGSIRADLAGDHLTGEGGLLMRGTLEAASMAWRGRWRAGANIRVTLVWIDPPAEPNGAGLDDLTPALLNDLDLTVQSPDGKTHYPWSLNPSTPSTEATNSGPNTVDNVERVDLLRSEAEAATGAEVWTITVSGPPEALGQEFVLAISGLEGE